jgi:hypothetical protein
MADDQKQLLLLHQLERESEDVQAEIDRLMSEMEQVPPDQRSEEDWGANGRLTKRFLELSNRQNELAAEIKLLAKAIEKAAPPKTAH